MYIGVLFRNSIRDETWTWSWVHVSCPLEPGSTAGQSRANQEWGIDYFTKKMWSSCTLQPKFCYCLSVLHLALCWRILLTIHTCKQRQHSLERMCHSVELLRWKCRFSEELAHVDSGKENNSISLQWLVPLVCGFTLNGLHYVSKEEENTIKRTNRNICTCKLKQGLSHSIWCVGEIWNLQHMNQVSDAFSCGSVQWTQFKKWHLIL